MRVIGFRVNPKNVFFVICDYNSVENTFNILTQESVVVPLSMEMPDILSYLRTNIFSIINEYTIELAGIRTIEDNAQSISIERTYIEGVIQELISNCSISKYFAGKKSRIASLIGMKVEDVSAFINGTENFLDIVSWPEIKLEHRECILSAYAALSL